jgi:hypothetical protein
MPFTYVTPEVVLTHGDVTVYRVYKNDNVEDPLTYWYTTDPHDIPESEFDIRTLDCTASEAAHAYPADEWPIHVLKLAIDRDLLPTPPDAPDATAGSEPAPLTCNAAIGSYLDLSTGHLPPDDRAILERDEHFGSIGRCDEGFFIPVRHTYPSTDLIAAAGLSQAMVQLVAYARAVNVSLIRLDTDGTIVNALPYFDS